MPDKHDERKKAARADEHDHTETPHNPAGDVELVTASHSTHEHGLQNKETNKANRNAVDIHSDDTNQRNTHVPKSEQLEHDLQAEDAKAK